MWYDFFFCPWIVTDPSDKGNSLTYERTVDSGEAGSVQRLDTRTVI